MALSSGKLLNLMRLADGAGRFKMLAVDQRGSLQAALGRATGRPTEAVGYDEMARTKALLTATLAPYATAVLTDPVYGLPRSATAIPGDVGVLVAAEETGYETIAADGQARRGRLIDGWSVAKTKRAGANAVKLLIHYNPEAPVDVLRHQQQLVQAVGEACLAEDIPFLLEPVTYPLAEASVDTPEFARRRPQHTIESAREFSRDAYHVDILKLEFPADLKHARPFAQAVFDARERPAVYDLDRVREACRQLDAAARRPWVVLSGGVGIAEFLVNLELAVDAGASGFLCGRAIWQDALPLYPDVARMEAWLRTTGASNFLRANATAERARPWFEHPAVGGREALQMRDAGAAWHRHYGA